MCIRHFLQSHHFPHHAVAGLDSTYQYEQVKNEFSNITPHRSHGRHIGVHRRRRGCHRGKDDACQSDHRPFQTYASVAFHKAAAHITCRFTRKCSQWDRGKSCIKIESKHTPIYCHDHNKGQNCNKQPAQQRDSPQRDAAPEPHCVDLVHDLLRQCRGSQSTCTRSTHGA